MTVAVHGGRDVIAIWPGFHDTIYGVAIDIGSTTIAGHLANLADGAVLASAGVMNPQIRFGEDLMSRVSYAMMHPEGAEEMTKAVRKALDGLLASLANRAGIKRAEILELALVGNPIMHHLLLGIDPTPLGGAPFALATDRAVHTTTAELGIRAHPGARVYVLPCIAGHVGADTAGVILAEEPQLADRMTLLVDVGTNAEIVLGDKRRLLAASSPTGPAFEGAQISGGQRAAPGAIERVRIDRTTLEPRFRVIGVEPWSDAPDFAEAVERDRRHRHLRLRDHRGHRRAVPRRHRHRGRRHRRVAGGALAADRPGRPDVQLRPERRHRTAARASPSPRTTCARSSSAKAALYAGVRLLMDQLEIDAVDEIRLAGAFGSQIDTTHAMVLGLIPDCDLDHVRSAGNAAGTGALIALLSAAARARDRGASSARSRRSRPPSSRASRRTSSRRWPSRTRPPTSRTWPGSCRCRRRSVGGGGAGRRRADGPNDDDGPVAAGTREDA